MDIKRVLITANGKTKFVILPKKSDVQAGDYVSIKKIEEAEVQRSNFAPASVSLNTNV